MDVQIPADLPRLKPRAPASHKGDFGRALLLGGSRDMSGAIALAGMACLRSGAGLTTLAVPDCCLETVAQFDPCYMTKPLPCDAEGKIALAVVQQVNQLVEPATCIAVGPGLGCNDVITAMVGALYRTLEQPMVIDADGLNALAASPDGLAGAVGPRILTPHPGEFARLAPPAKKQPLTDQAFELARQYNIIIVLKGQHTLITDGHQRFENTTGNPGLAKGGSGDVLTGVITALVCQGLAPLAAARLGVFAHGLAGDLAAEELGQVAMTAQDVLLALPRAWRMLG